MPCGRGGLHDGDGLLIKELNELVGIRRLVTGGKMDVSTCDERQVEFKGSDVEGEGGNGKEGVMG